MTKASTWTFSGGQLDLARSRVMAVVNLTPDSFSDGGKLMVDERDAPNVSVALRRCQQLLSHGADILDVGGESTRPGAEPLSPQREIARVMPVVAALVEAGIAAPISIDTRHAEVAHLAIAAGAHIVNDVSGLADPAMTEVVARTNAGLILGHLRGEPQSMQHHIDFTDVVSEVCAELAASVERAVAGGIARRQIMVDPGIGFGKTAEQSAALVGAGRQLQVATGCPVLIGASRKAFLGAIDPSATLPKDRLITSVAAAVMAVERGAAMVRVHDVRETVLALAVAQQIRDARGSTRQSGGAPC